jgi:hypothetical protein
LKGFLADIVWFYDYIPLERLVMTQELIANILGVRREGVLPKRLDN